MANVDFTVDSDLPAPVILAAAVDFSTRRPDLWPMIDRSVYEVHASGPGWAEVTEGSRFLGAIWAREHYDWSVPGVVQATAGGCGQSIPRRDFSACGPVTRRCSRR